MNNRQQPSYFLHSFIFHVVVLLAFIVSFNMTSTMPVFENTNKNDAISAVVLGDTQKSKILPQKLASDMPKPIEPPKPTPAPEVKPAVKPVVPQKDVIALKKADNKKKLQDDLQKKLLADIQKATQKPKKVDQPKTQTNFQKLLQQQAEKSLRQQLLNEEIKLQGTEAKQSQGVVDKYKALILQAISEHWLVPTQSKKNISSELMIRLAPGGVVLDVQITKSSGDPALDSSARAAVLQSSPLPVPKEAGQFEPFRQFILKVKPENVMPA